MDPSDQRETLEQLVALGYIERPDADNTKAVASTQRELDYNLAMAYVDAAMHPKAAEIFADLYRQHPLEFRFGIRLAVCLQAMDRREDMALVVDHLNEGWRKAAETARARLREIAEMARERRTQLHTQSKAGGRDANGHKQQPHPRLFNDAESRVVRQLRAIARGNPQTLDSLAASIAMSQKDYDAALVHLERAQESATRTPGFHLQIGNAYLELKRTVDAERSYRRVLELDPENPNAHVGLCRVALKRRRNGEALKAAQAAVGLKYHFPPAHYFLGVAHARLGHTQEAIDSLNRALSQNPNFPEAHRQLARIYRLHLKDEAAAAEHRAAARRITQERRRQLAARPRPVLPPLEAIDPDALLPAFPEPVAITMKPPLAMAPIEGQQRNDDDRPFVTVVSGLPRSGTSMMMQMLVAGGLVPVTDNERTADDSNPRGYFELEKTKRLQMDNCWLDEARGKVIKVVAPLVPFLPQDCGYRVLIMERDLDEVVSSQGAMLERLEREGGKLDGDRLRDGLAGHLRQAKAVLEGHGVPVLAVGYGDALNDPTATARAVAGFLGIDLDRDAMIRAVDPALYRHHKE